MWDQGYTPVHGSLGLSAACAALPILVLLVALGVFRMSAWKAGVLGLLTSIVVAIGIYGMPVPLALHTTVKNATFGRGPGAGGGGGARARGRRAGGAGRGGGGGNAGG